MNGKTIRIFLADGEPTGILLAEISNWTGKVIVAPRSQLDQLSKREEVRRTGVYLLVGPDPDDSSRQLVYIGETDNVLKRLLSHNRKEAKDFWERTVVIVNKDENLTKSHVRYLESRLIKLAQDARRANLTNDTAPEPASLPEPDVADMEFFIEQVQMILPVLGFDFTQPAPTAAGHQGKATSPLFVLHRVGATARAREIDGEFVVYAGATARKQGVKGWRSYKALRAQLVKDEKLVDGPDPNLLVLAEDVAFKSPSAAASAIVGGAVNGRRNWKTEDGQTYAAWQEAKLVEVDIVAEPDAADED
jgi:predicted GIY-YIG superfamily endonuclease